MENLQMEEFLENQLKFKEIFHQLQQINENSTNFIYCFSKNSF